MAVRTPGERQADFLSSWMRPFRGGKSMFTVKTSKRTGCRRRATVLIQAAVFGAVVGVGMMALAIDTGLMFVTRGELQNAADASALAAAGTLADDPTSDVASLRATAQYFADANHSVDGILADADFVLGHWDTGIKVFTTGGNPINAARVITRRSEANSNAVKLFFANFIGVNEADISATGIAYLIKIKGAQ